MSISKNAAPQGEGKSVLQDWSRTSGILEELLPWRTRPNLTKWSQTIRQNRFQTLFNPLAKKNKKCLPMVYQDEPKKHWNAADGQPCPCASVAACKDGGWQTEDTEGETWRAAAVKKRADWCRWRATWWQGERMKLYSLSVNTGEHAEAL